VAALDVVMPVYNGVPYLDDSVASILEQTFEDFELVVLKNGSTDGSRERLDWWARRDPRVTVHHRDRRLGGAASSREAVELTRTPVVARMDADDVAHPERLERQLAVMAEHPDATLVTTLHGYLDARGRPVRGRDRWSLEPGAAPMPFSGGCLMFRRDAYERVGGYREVTGTWEDFDLCQRLAGDGRVLVIPEALYWCRFHPTSRTARAPVSSRAGRPGEVPAGALFELNSIQLWAGERPAHLEELRQAARECRPGRRLALRLWARWAQLSPGSLRAGLRWRSRIRDRLASPWVPATKPWEWRPA
jgi:GT2 family glycosyltransferase